MKNELCQDQLILINEIKDFAERAISKMTGMQVSYTVSTGKIQFENFSARLYFNSDGELYDISYQIGNCELQDKLDYIIAVGKISEDIKEGLHFTSKMQLDMKKFHLLDSQIKDEVAAGYKQSSQDEYRYLKELLPNKTAVNRLPKYRVYEIACWIDKSVRVSMTKKQLVELIMDRLYG